MDDESQIECFTVPDRFGTLDEQVRCGCGNLTVGPVTGATITEVTMQCLQCHEIVALA